MTRISGQVFVDLVWGKEVLLVLVLGNIHQHRYLGDTRMYSYCEYEMQLLVLVEEVAGKHQLLFEL